MSKKTVLITGCLGTIGQAVAHGFREAGFHVLGTDKEPGDRADDSYFEMDLQAFVEKPSIQERFVSWADKSSRGKLFCLIHNAATQILGGVTDLTLADWDKSLKTNLTAPLLLTQKLLRQLEAAKGSIVHVTSIHSRLTKRGFVAYATSKAALEGLTRSMAVDLGGRVRVNSVAPAAIHTPMLEQSFQGDTSRLRQLGSFHPAGNVGQAKEVFDAIFYLATAKSPFLTGTTLNLDGGIGSRLHDPE